MRKTTRHKDALLIHLGDAIRNRRVDIGMTQQELALKSDLHRTYITDVEGGNRNLSLLTYNRLTDALLCAMSFPLVEAERSMAADAASPLYGVRGGLSKESRLLHTSSNFYVDLNIIALELLVKANMSILQVAVESFARTNKLYPCNKKEVVEALAGQLPLNPFTKRISHLAIGTAITDEFSTSLACSLRPGALEYSPVNSGANYVIRAGGANGEGLRGRSGDSIYVLSGNLRTNNQP
jgi:transcriptional regulator with XRE-family HTH domain